MMMHHPFADSLLDDLSRRFAAHATIYRGTSPHNASPLYAHLAQVAATDADLLGLVRDADRATQVSNLLFGAVHFLLLSGIQHLLAAFYTSLTSTPRPPHAAAPYFRAFCGEHAAAIMQLVTTRRVQTNEVQRCTGLLPAFHLVAQQYPDRPLALVEIGASAGLHLLWDRYRYDYGSLGQTGDLHSPVQLTCAVTGPHTPSIPAQVPRIASRIGIDLLPVDINDEAATRWVRALIWPEQMDRAHLFTHALRVAQHHPPHVLTGDAADRLPAVLAALPQDAIACVYHSYTLNQCPPTVRECILERLQAYAATRSLVRVSLEWYGNQAQPQLELVTYADTTEQPTLLAYCESHGRAIEWLRADDYNG